MEKEKRLLYFFLLMINGEKINRSELIRKTMKTSRTIRRDMDVNSGLKMLFYGGLKMSFFGGLRMTYV
ncbi:hypothetical protein [Staphylococcus pseudintermedius]|uniref:hypothetical protein n=1 Tax=Staphylococcus pseudintermedius TaxID=283734 RepID=UPI001933D759|nr:hypothetical protein [Staphylococcus pseudintermedius]MBM0313099.1 hypothetical protein [Staphylococcus pseudintermedius]